MFSQVSLCQRGGGQVYTPWANPTRQTPSGQTLPSRQTPLSADIPSGQPPLSEKTPLRQTPPGQTPPWADTPLGRHSLRQIPLWADTIPPHTRRPLQRTVRILLERILVGIQVHVIHDDCIFLLPELLSHS